jgi:hypothetical protein
MIEDLMRECLMGDKAPTDLREGRGKVELVDAVVTGE